MELAFEDPCFESEEEREFSPELRARIEAWREGFVRHVERGVKAASAGGQAGLVFNGAILLWNNYLPALKRANFPDVIFPGALGALQESFEAMNNALASYEYGQGV